MNVATFSGLGDAVYAYPVIKELTRTEPVTVWTKYPDVFTGLSGVSFSAEKAGAVLGYSRGPERNFYADIVAAAGIAAPEFAAEFAILDRHREWARAKGKPVCIIKEPHATDMHKKARDFSLAPSVKAMQGFIDRQREAFYFVAVDGPDDVYRERLDGIGERLSGLNVREYLSLCSVVSAFASQIGHLVPIAQALGKRLFLFEPEKNTAQNTRHVRASSVIVKGKENLVEVFK